MKQNSKLESSTNPSNLIEKFLYFVKESPNSLAVVSDIYSLTYKELDVRSSSLAMKIQREYPEKSNVIAVALGREIDLLVSILGILKAGRVFLLLDPNQPINRLRYMIEDSKVDYIISSSNYYHFSIPNIPIDTLDDLGNFSLRKCENAYIIYTSGTSGRPKGVLVSHKALDVYLRFAAANYLTTGKGAVVFSSVAVDLTFTSLFAPFYAGKTIFLIDDDSPEVLADFILNNEGFSFLKTTPSGLRALEQLVPPSMFGRFTNKIVLGGESLYANSLDFLYNVEPEIVIINEYGPTEAVVGCCTYSNVIRNLKPGKIPIGDPINGCNIYLLNANGELDDEGEIIISGNNLAEGYINENVIEDSGFISIDLPYEGNLSCYKTGDWAKRNSSDGLIYSGRRDRQVKIHGYRVELDEIEETLSRHSVISQCRVLWRDNNAKAFYLTTVDPPPLIDQILIDYLKSELPFYLVPTDLIFCKDFPLSLSGKIDDDKLSQYLNATKSNLLTIKPGTQIEETLLEVWKDVLQNPNITIDQNFFNIGGDSVTALYIVAACNEKGLYFRSIDILENPTIRNLAKVTAINNSDYSEKNDNTSLYELTVSDNQLAFLLLNHPKTNIWVLPWLSEFKVKLNPDILEQALILIQEKHSALKSRFFKNGNTWAVKTESIKSNRAPFEIISFDVDREKEMFQYVKEQRTKLDIFDGPLHHLALISIGNKQYLSWVVHHLVVDFVSLNILTNDLKRVYGEILGGAKVSTLNPLVPIKKNGVVKFGNIEEIPEIISGQLDVEFILEGQLATREIWVILICAFAKSILLTTNERQIEVICESHGRENILSEDLVGWITSYPTLSIPDLDISQLCNIVNEQLAGISSKIEQYTPYCINFLGKTNNFNIDPFKTNLFLENVGFFDQEKLILFDLEFICWISDTTFHYQFCYSNKFNRQQIEEILHNTVTAFHKFDFSSISSEIGNIPSRNFKQELVPHSNDLDLVKNPDLLYEPFPLTNLQLAYLLGRESHFQLGGVDSKLYAEIDIHNIELREVEDVINKLITIHPILRMVVIGDSKQKIIKHAPKFRITEVNLRKKGDFGKELILMRETLSHKQLDPKEWPLFDIHAALLPGGKIRLFISVDLMLGDARTWQILIRDFGKLFSNAGYIPISNQFEFRDYVSALQSMKSNSSYQRAKEYWYNKIDELPLAPKLPVLSHLKGKNNHFSRRKETLNQDQWNTIKEIATNSGVTPTCLLVSVFSEVLRRYSETESFTLNLTITQRPESMMETAGDFTSLLALPFYYSKEPFSKRLKQNQKLLWESIEHRWFDGIDVIRELRRRNSLFDQSIFPVVFTGSLNLGNYLSEWNSSIDAKVNYSIGQTPQVYLDYQTYILDDELVIVWDWVDGLFPESLVEDMFLTHYKTLRRLIENPNLINEDRLLDLLPIPKITPPTVGSNNTLTSGFLSAALSQPEAIAIKEGKLSFTYKQLRADSFKIKSIISKLIAGRDKYIAIEMHQSYLGVASIFGVLFSGNAWIPLDPEWPLNRRRKIIENANCEVIVKLGEGDLNLDFYQNDKKVKTLNLLVETKNTDLIPVKVSSSSIAYVIHTSGTTGNPKGAMITHKSALNTIIDINSRIKLNPSDSILAISPSTFDLSIYDIFGPLSVGARVVIPASKTRKDPAIWLDTLINEEITIWNSVPLLMNLLLEQARFRGYDLGLLRVIMLSGDWIPLPLAKPIVQETNIRLISMGGATECSIWSIFYEVNEVNPLWKSIPYGFSLAGQLVTVRDIYMGILPVGIPGEIYISGEGLAKGYLNDSEQTESHFFVDPYTGDPVYRTGDWGKLSPDGSIEFLGRKDDQVKVRGFRVELKEIEKNLAELPEVSNISVMAEGPKGEKKILAFIISDFSKKEIYLAMQNTLPEYLHPSEIHIVDSFPINSNGKLDKRLLLGSRSVEEKNTLTNNGSLPIISLVKDFMGMKDINTDDDLISLGLDSLDMIKLINRIEIELNWRPEINLFVTNPTIQNLIGQRNSKKAGLIKTGEEDKGIYYNSIWDQFETIKDDLEKEKFRMRVRNSLNYKKSIPQILTLDNLSVFESIVQHRKSYRSYKKEPIDLDQFSRFLRCLEQREIDGDLRALYPSAGGLYSIMVWIIVKPNRIQTLSSGLYLYMPFQHNLLPVIENIDFHDTIHFGQTNRSMYSESAFTILLLGDPSKIGPIYGRDSEKLLFIDSGYMSQLLSISSIENGIGLCPIGNFDFEKIRSFFPDSENLIFIHGLVGGKIDFPGTYKNPKKQIYFN